jgi:hypothetical protein
MDSSTLSQRINNSTLGSAIKATSSSLGSVNSLLDEPRAGADPQTADQQEVRVTLFVGFASFLTYMFSYGFQRPWVVAVFCGADDDDNCDTLIGLYCDFSVFSPSLTTFWNTRFPHICRPRNKAPNCNRPKHQLPMWEVYSDVHCAQFAGEPKNAFHVFHSLCFIVLLGFDGNCRSRFQLTMVRTSDDCRGHISYDTTMVTDLSLPRGTAIRRGSCGHPQCQLRCRWWSYEAPWCLGT